MTAAGGAAGRRTVRPWPVDLRAGTAAELHGPWPPPPSSGPPRLAVCQVTAPALVLGSAQGLQAAACAPVAPPEGVDVVRRRGGGGAVLVRPGGQVWVDVWLPRGHPHWDDDVVRAALWVGEAWAAALADRGVHHLAVHRAGLCWPSAPDTATAGRARADVAAHNGPDVGEPLAMAGGNLPVADGDLAAGRVPAPVRGAVCFAGHGPGEVLAGRPGRKMVGITQHRTRAGARFVTCALARWEPQATVDALCRIGVVDPLWRTALIADVAPLAIGLVDLGLVDHGAVVDAVVRRLSAA